jgi:hypothetical protein
MVGDLFVAVDANVFWIGGGVLSSPP